MRNLYSLLIAEPLNSLGRATPMQTVHIDIDPEVTQLSFSTTCPGGFSTLEVGLRDPATPQYGYLPKIVALPAFAHVQLWDGSFLLHEGRVMWASRPGGDIRGFRSVGYGFTALTDGYYTSTDATASTSSAVLLDVLAFAAPLIRAEQGELFRDPGTAHTRAEMDGMVPTSVLDQLSKEGGPSGYTQSDWFYSPWDGLVYENRRLTWLPREPNTTPEYLIPFDDTVIWEEDYSSMYSHAATRYTLAGVVTTTAQVESPGFAQAWGFTRYQLLNGGEMTAAGATQFATTWLQVHSSPDVSCTIARTRDRGLEKRGGWEIPARNVRAGVGWVQVGDQPYLPITQTQCNLNTEETTIELGSPRAEDIAEYYATLCDETAKLSRFVSPITGSRTR
jgi:hypothetical protein